MNPVNKAMLELAKSPSAFHRPPSFFLPSRLNPWRAFSLGFSTLVATTIVGSAQTKQPSFQPPQATIQVPQASAPSAKPATISAPASGPAVAATGKPSVAVSSVGSVSPTTAPTQITAPPFEVYTDYNWGNAMAKKLRNAPAKLYNFDRASLRDVLRFLADDAGIPFVAMQESSAVENTLVTFTFRASPFLALETIARANSVAIFYDNGIWFMRPLNEQELIARTYKLKFNPQDIVKYTGAQNQNSSNGGQEGGIAGMDLTLQNPTDVFKVEIPRTVEEIKKLLGIPTSGFHAANAGETNVEHPNKLNVPPSLNPAGSALAGAPKGDGGAQAIYNPDANTIYVVATRQQHQWVEGFLSAADRPQSLIGIEIKFLETTKDPTKDFGIDWSETMEGGYSVTAAGEASATGGLSTSALSDTLDSFSRFSLNENINGVQNNQTTTTRNRSSSNTGTRQNELNAGYTAVLSPDAVTVTLQAFMRDRDTSVVQYPRMLTINNREVAIRSVVNQPVLASTSAVDQGQNVGTTASEVAYLPIGTIINVLPKTMPDGSVILNVAITISRIVGFEDITLQPGQTQPYPVPASRVYNASLQVDSGYTLAVSGLDESTDSRNNTGIPFLKDIPGVGQLFKSKSRDQIKKNLIIFITPTVINDRRASQGIATVPEAIIPLRPDMPSPPAFSSSGRLVGGAAAIDEALAWMDFQMQVFTQRKEESMTDKKSQEQLKGVISSLEMLILEIQRLEEESPAQVAQLTKQEEKALKLLADLNKLYRGINRKDAEF